MMKMENIQEIRKCKNKKCQRLLPEGYKYRYCENCRNEHAEKVRDGIKVGVGFVASAALFVVSKGKFGNNGDKNA